MLITSYAKRHSLEDLQFKNVLFLGIRKIYIEFLKNCNSMIKVYFAKVII